METSTQTMAILKSLDMELKALLQQDVERFKAQHTKQAPVKTAA